jgi:hypothetical protein
MSAPHFCPNCKFSSSFLRGSVNLFPISWLQDAAQRLLRIRIIISPNCSFVHKGAAYIPKSNKKPGTQILQVAVCTDARKHFYMRTQPSNHQEIHIIYFSQRMYNYIMIIALNSFFLGTMMISQTTISWTTISRTYISQKSKSRTTRYILNDDISKASFDQTTIDRMRQQHLFYNSGPNSPLLGPWFRP